MVNDKPVEAKAAKILPDQPLVSDQDMVEYPKIVESGNRADGKPLPGVDLYDSAAVRPGQEALAAIRSLERPGTPGQPAAAGDRPRILPMPAGGAADGRLNTLPARPGDDGVVRIQPGEWGAEPGNRPLRRGELPPDMIKDLQRHLDDLVIGPPEAMAKLPSAEQQKSYRDQAKIIAALIRKNGDFYAGLKRENVEGMFAAATRAGEEDLNYLVRAVNSELSKTNLQLGYNFGTEKAWFSEDTHGASVYKPPISVDENRSTVALIKRSNNTIETEDRIRSKASGIMPGYIPSSDPRPKLIPVLE